jgi:2-oxoglutarate dehydrogenase E2 component (dihydrolipoamide succinyltransferase)
MASVEIKVPVLPESVADATIATWYKKPGEVVKRDEHLVDVETDKVVLEVVAPGDGTLDQILKPKGALVKAQEVIALFTVGAVTPVASVKAIPQPEPQPAQAPVSQPASEKKQETATSPVSLSPAVRRLATEQSVDTSTIKGSGKGGRIVKEDILQVVGKKAEASTPVVTAPVATTQGSNRAEKRVPMSRLRARIAERLIEAQQTAAILTTFNEVNMQPIMDIRQKYKDLFEKKYQVRLGFMSFFALAVIEALKRFPAVNASIEGQDIVYHDYYDIGIAVSSPRGLIVPVLRNVEAMSMPQIEAAIATFGQKAKDNQLTVDDITGGTFTISNGGVFGSLMSTPILNPPQSAILGMHKIEERPIVEHGQVVIRPMMYLALSYDHRIIDGAESVRFLVTIKEQLEDPARLLLGV